MLYHFSICFLFLKSKIWIYVLINVFVGSITLLEFSSVSDLYVVCKKGRRVFCHNAPIWMDEFQQLLLKIETSEKLLELLNSVANGDSRFASHTYQQLKKTLQHFHCKRISCRVIDVIRKILETPRCQAIAVFSLIHPHSLFMLELRKKLFRKCLWLHLVLVWDLSGVNICIVVKFQLKFNWVVIVKSKQNSLEVI